VVLAAACTAAEMARDSEMHEESQKHSSMGAEVPVAVPESSMALAGAAAVALDKKEKCALGPPPFRSKASLRRAAVSELPLLHEERSLESTFHLTLLLPMGPVGQEFMQCTCAGFAKAEGDAVVNASPQDRILVPYADRKNALVSLRQVGPVEALEHARTRSASAFSEDRPQALPETADEMSALSTALIYVVADSSEQQLGPICAVEASYAAVRRHRPCRWLVALHDPGEENLPAGAPEGSPGFLGEAILQELQSRRVGHLPCRSVVRRRLASHRAFLVHVVETLAGHFCKVTAPKETEAEAATITPSSSRPSTPRESTRGSSFAGAAS